jgi:crossover junction endodeoxyribonuclease RuvC
VRILGIDPGLRLTGYAVISFADADPERPTLVEAGVFRFNDKHPVSARLVELERDLADLIERTAPTHAAVEGLYSHYAHPMTGVIMAHARGVVLLTIRKNGLPLMELPPTEVKKAITGNGHAKKAQVQAAVATVLNLAVPPDPPDVADAMAIALCAAGRVG